MKKFILQQPNIYDIVDETILIGGLVGGFESDLTVIVGDGHYEYKFYLNASNKNIRQFQEKLILPQSVEFEIERIYIVVTENETSGSEYLTMMPLFYGPKILPGYVGYEEYIVKKGDTLSSIARNYYNDANKWSVIYHANSHIIHNPNLIKVGEVLRIPCSMYSNC